MSLINLKQGLLTPQSYRLGNRIVRIHIHVILIIVMILVFGIYTIIYGAPLKSNWSCVNEVYYNTTYPLTNSLIVNDLRVYKIGLIADLDTKSKCDKEKNTWRSYYKIGYLKYNSFKKFIGISWDKSDLIELRSGYALKGRGMELSELVVYNGNLLTFDDRTGIVYKIQSNQVIPWLILNDGDGNISKGFKSEWATVKNKELYVGSIGKDWTNSQGEYENSNPMYVKVVNVAGEIKHVNWKNHYEALGERIGIKWPGYLIHESGMWSEKHKHWFFLPRRCSTERYNETKDEYMGCNVLLKANEYFSYIKSINIGKLIPTRGYSSFKFIPGTNDDIIVALSSEEVNGTTSTYISAFTINGEIMLKQEKISGNLKYEGIEFI